MPETMKLFGSTTNNLIKKNGENLPYFEIIEVVLVHCNVVNNYYKHDSRVLHTFVSHKPFR